MAQIHADAKKLLGQTVARRGLAVVDLPHPDYSHYDTMGQRFTVAQGDTTMHIDLASTELVIFTLNEIHNQNPEWDYK